MTIELKPNRKRRFTSQQKFEILVEWEECKDIQLICDKYGLHHTTIYRWKARFEAGKNHFLGPNNPHFEAKIKLLRDEINKLKEVVVQQAYEITLLKKSMK